MSEVTERPDITMEIEASREVQQSPVDDTLSISGVAADAKATGDAITEVSDYVGSGTLPRSATSVLGALTTISNLIGNETLPYTATTLGGALTAIAAKLGDGIQDTTLTAAIELINTTIGNTALPYSATTVTGAIDAIFSHMVKTVNNVSPDANGNVALTINTGVMTVNGNSPDAEGNIDVDVDLSNLKVNGQSVDENNEITVDVGVKKVNGEDPDSSGNATVDTGVMTVNDEEPDASGNIDIDRVKWADDLYTEDTQTVTGSFIQRSTAGAASIQDGTGIINLMRGNSVRTGYTAEAHSMTVTSTNELTVAIDWDTFRTAVSDEDTELSITYSGSAWSYDLTTLGITISSGTPTENDVIAISFTAEVRGTITNASPSSFTSTGWNLYDNSTGYARVVKYSDTYGYRIDGTYTSLAYCATIGGTETAVTPDSNGLFNISADGYIKVTGGNDTSTAIYTTWSDWVDGTPEDFESHTTYVILLNTAISSIFAAGMCSIGEVYDELNPQTGAYTRRINRVDYSAVNLASVIAGGTAYWYDTNYIYYVLSTPITGTVTMTSTFTASSHGIEYYDGTSVPIYTSILYGQNLKDKLRRDVLTISKQDLTAEQKAQVRGNVDTKPTFYIERNFDNVNGAAQTYQTVISTLIGLMTEDGHYVFSGWWAGHSYGYDAHCERRPYVDGKTAVSGIVYAYDGNVWSFITRIVSGVPETLTIAPLSAKSTNYTGMTYKANTNGTVYQNQVQRRGNIVSAVGRIAGMTANNAANGTYFTVPEGYRPPMAVYVPGSIVLSDGAVSVPAIINISANGEVVLAYSSSVNISQFYFCGTYAI